MGQKGRNGRNTNGKRRKQRVVRHVTKHNAVNATKGSSMMAVLPPARSNNVRYNDVNHTINQDTANHNINNNPPRQQQFIMEEQHSHGILRYPVAQRTAVNRAAGRYNNTQQPMVQQHQMQQLPHQPHPQHQQHQPLHTQNHASTYHVQPPTGVQIVPGNNTVPTEVRLSYSVMPRVATAPSASIGGGNGYQGLQATREEAHSHRMATISNRAQSALPSVRTKTSTMRVMSSTRKQPKGSLSQKPRTRRVKLGKNKVRTGG